MTHVLGIDIACESFVARLLACQPTVTPVGEGMTFENSTDGFGKCLSWLLTLGLHPEETLIVVEATGVYWEALALFFYDRQFHLSVTNPAQIKYFSRSVLQRGKSDQLDANLIALFGARMNPRLWEAPSPISEELQVLMRQRDAYVAMLTEELCRLHAFEHAGHTPHQALAICKRTIAFLRQQIKDIDASFKNTLNGDARWKKLYDLVQTIPGIGTVTAGVFLTETRALNEFSSARQLTAYTGIAPIPYSSGSSVLKKPRISKIGNARLRKAFYMAAISSVRFNPHMRIFFQRLVARGKPKKLILIAIARKLLVLCFAVCKSQIPYQPDYARA
jgi:transposase